MYSPVLSVPTPCVSAWVAETDPKYAGVWLASLPMADSAESAREIYQALYTINRLDLRLSDRLELMTMYDGAVGTVCLGLQPHLIHESPPLSLKKRQLAEFIRRLHIEMAYGYKCCLRDLSRARLTRRRRERSAVCIERALYHSSQVLLRSYVVYLPYPAGVWRETHELYRLAESLGIGDGLPDVAVKDGVHTATITERYVQTVLLGLINPYQLPHGAAEQVQAFLARWDGQVSIVPEVGRADTAGCFLIDLEADAPPVPLAKNGPRPGEATRILDARVLLQTIQSFVVRLERGETIEDLGLGVDCLDSAYVDLLQRMIRAWGETARRRYTRRQESSNVFVCIGLGVAHFYINGQRSFATYAQPLIADQAPADKDAGDVAFIDLDEVQPQEADAVPVTSPITQPLVESRRVNRWRLRDIGPQGMSLTRYGEAMSPIRVGDLLGVQQPTDLGRWRVAVVRWIKTPEANSVEIGVEILAASVAPALIQRYKKADAAALQPALLLPATEVTKRPPTLVLPRGECHVSDVIEVRDEESAPRQLRILRLIERTGSFEQFEFGEIVAPTLRRP